ncbi:metallophosphoesterase [Vulcanisaeta sp. JCM 14467]|uniref:metallophosphoesterase n=1 Tax=Vulcanisaeta sp. JCM 14467 TaxID=1295370 RepID=UPI002092310A|nr:metallophosphoesterase [Vulcanisaeta sp. JCM 14467]
MGRLRVLLVSDLHGSSVAFGKLSNAIKFYKADVVVFAGDLTGKALVPLLGRMVPSALVLALVSMWLMSLAMLRQWVIRTLIR